VERQLTALLKPTELTVMTTLRPPRDPRWFQIGALSGLLLYGWLSLGFDVTGPRILLTLGCVLLCQGIATRLWRLPAFDPKSALISGLSLCLLLRTNSDWLVVLAAAVAIFSKFLVRWRDKHVFNPTNVALASLLLAGGGQVWLSSGQWGSLAFFAFLMLCAGNLVVWRAARSDVAIAFLACHMALLLGRSAWLGEPMTIPFHRLESGALLLFAFFMISDPKTTPDSRAGRILFALLVSLGAYYIQFKLFRQNGLVLSLAACSMLVPAIDLLLPGRRYAWTTPRARNLSEPTAPVSGAILTRA
jgi:Na+-translocating ferredoxin:NAD+ oxidoreductase RnfD subunit